MPDDFPKFPDQEELERELSEYLSKKYGYRIKVISPMMMPQTKEAQEPPRRSTGGIDNIHFDMKPEELRNHLDQFVVQQEEAKAILATKVCTHYNRVRYQRRKHRGGAEPMVGRIKNNILLLGPTGVGKTYLVKLIAQKLGVPFVKGDATKFSETGYVGGDVEDLVRELVVQADDDIELAEHGIVYIDEIDKIASSQNLIGPDVSRTGVQRALLKPMEETEIDLKVPHDPISQLEALEQFRKSGKREKRKVNTRNILFIMSGAFNGLGEIVRRRLQRQGIGFGAEIHRREEDPGLLRRAKAEDLIQYGFESEFVGRLPVIAVLDPLEVEDLYAILKNPNNPIILGKKEDFHSYGIDIKFDDQALHVLAERAHHEKTGARGLVSVIERVLLPFELSLPSSPVQYLVVTRAVVEAPQAILDQVVESPDDAERFKAYQTVLEDEKRSVRDLVSKRMRHYVENYPFIFNESRIELVVETHVRLGFPVERIFDDVILLYNQVRVFENDFFERHALEIHFNEEAVDEIVRQALERDVSAASICARISRDYDYGLKLISERTGQTHFELPKRAVTHHEEFLDEAIRENYRQNPLNQDLKDPS